MPRSFVDPKTEHARHARMKPDGGILSALAANCSAAGRSRIAPNPIAATDLCRSITSTTV
jgi:hypothetical protein